MRITANKSKEVIDTKKGKATVWITSLFINISRNIRDIIPELKKGKFRLLNKTSHSKMSFGPHHLS